MPVAPRLYKRARVLPYYPKREKTVVSRPRAGDFNAEDKHAYWASQAAYGEDLYHQKLLGAGYKLDTDLSGNRYKVYYNDKGAIVANRGTKLTDLQDLQADAGLAFYDFETPGFLESQSITKRAIGKYKNVLHTGHSLGGSKALRNSQNLGGRAVVFNPGSSAFGTNAGENKVYTAQDDIIANRVYGTNITKVKGAEHSLSQYENLFQ
jgi:hypothetical protein